MSIPLIQEATKDAINTSIIAIKRNIERINMLLGLVDSESPDLSGFATKQELQDAVESLQPVDEVALDNMQSVTSNAVAEYASPIIKKKTATLNNVVITSNGYVDIRSSFPSGMNNFLFALVWDYGRTTSKDAIAVNASGTYIGATANSTIDNITIVYFYTD